MLRKLLVLCLLLVIATALSARVRVAAFEDPRSSTDVVFAVDTEGYLHSVEPTGWVQINEQPCPTAGPYDLDTFYDASIEDIVVLVVDGEGLVYAVNTEEWLPITEVPADGEGPYLISTLYYDDKDMNILTLLDDDGQLLAWYWAEYHYESVMSPLPEAESYSITDHIEQGDDNSYQLHAVDSTGTVYTFLADGWHEYPVSAEGEPPFQIGILDTSTGMIDLVVSLDGTITFIKDAEEAKLQSATLDGEPPYDLDLAHTQGTDSYRSYLVDSHGTLYSFDGESWIQVLDRLPE